MAITDDHVQATRSGAFVPGRRDVGPTRPPRALQQTFRLLLATVWLLDAVLQLQPFMFTPAANGFSGMLVGSRREIPGGSTES